MTEPFRRSLEAARPQRRPAAVCMAPPSDRERNRLSALVLALILFDRNPGVLATQVRAWLEEGSDA